MKYQILTILVVILISCKKTKTHYTNDTSNIKTTNENINNLDKTDQTKIVKLYKITDSYKEKKDVLIDSLFLDIPSEGSIVKIYKKDKNKLFIINSISSMNKYNYEIYFKLDSIFVLKKTENYDRPLNIAGVKLTSQNYEYALFVNNYLLQYVKNDTIEGNELNKKEKAKELRDLLNQIKDLQ